MAHFKRAMPAIESGSGPGPDNYNFTQVALITVSMKHEFFYHNIIIIIVRILSKLLASMFSLHLHDDDA